MKKILKLLKKYYKLVIIILIVLIVILLSLFIYKNLFQSGVSERLDGIENYKLTKTEKTEVKELFKELEEIKNVKIETNYKIIKIYLELSEDVDFEDIKEISNEAVQKFSEDNLSFYDVELFVTSLNEESEVYPKLGYKHKTNSEFTWNR